MLYAEPFWERSFHNLFDEPFSVFRVAWDRDRLLHERFWTEIAIAALMMHWRINMPHSFVEGVLDGRLRITLDPADQAYSIHDERDE